MSQNRIPVLEGGVIVADTLSTAGAVVTRDPTTSGIAVGPISATSITKTGPDSVTPVTALTANTTLTATSGPMQRLNATGGIFTVTLPAVATASGLIFTFIKTDSSGNLPTVKGSGSELIGGANTYTGLSAQYNYLTVWCDGTQWYWVAKG